MLKRFWITFSDCADYNPYMAGFGHGVGVTAYNVEDAKGILVQEMFENGLPPIKEIIENITYDDLEKNHVKMNMGVIVNRGIWYPKGFESLRIL